MLRRDAENYGVLRDELRTNRDMLDLCVWSVAHARESARTVNVVIGFNEFAYIGRARISA